jgi:isoquinoline 1-oxidoreductase subunit alpha
MNWESAFSMCPDLRLSKNSLGSRYGKKSCSAHQTSKKQPRLKPNSFTFPCFSVRCPHTQVQADMADFTLRVNGNQHKVSVAAETPLLWVLRDTLQLTGTKFGCGAGLCGACTVHLDGAAARSCSTPVSQVGNKNITTIEGISANGLHPVQQAWVAEQVPQCGYCQTGQIMAAVALLAKNPQPNDEQITEAMNGNLCRCGTYERIRRAIHRATSNGGAR